MTRTGPADGSHGSVESASEAQRNGSSGGKQMKTENETVQSSKGDAKPPHNPPPAQASRSRHYVAAKEKRGPRLKGTCIAPKKTKADNDATVVMKHAGGSKSATGMTRSSIRRCSRCG